MSEAAKCPVCGEMPRIRYGGIFGKTPVAYSHCGASFDTLELWNQYIAAMKVLKSSEAMRTDVANWNSDGSDI